MTNPVPQPPEIVSAACAACGVGISEFMSRQKSPEAIRAREVCVVLMRTLTPMSYPEIARAMGRPNHSTTITIYRRAAAMLAQGHPEFAGQIDLATRSAHHMALGRLAGSPRQMRSPIGVDPRLAVARLDRAERSLADLRRINRQQEDDLERRIKAERESLGTNKEHRTWTTPKTAPARPSPRPVGTPASSTAGWTATPPAAPAACAASTASTPRLTATRKVGSPSA